MASSGTAKVRVERGDAAGAAAPLQAGLTRAEFASMFVGSWTMLRTIAVAVLGSASQADDVLQEAAVIALEKLSAFRPGTCFEAWMGQIVRFVALNAARRGRRQAGALSLAASEPPARRAVLDGSFDDRLTAALLGLDPTARECLLLRVLHDAPYRRIALLLDIPEGTAMSHVHRARQTLREVLSSQKDPTTARNDHR